MSLPLPQTLLIHLLSDTAFGGGVSTTGDVDSEIEHDAHGLPCLGGKKLYGLLANGWAAMRPAFPGLRTAGMRLFGDITNDMVLDASSELLRLHSARLAQEVCDWAEYAVRRKDYPVVPRDILHAMTAIRTMTAVDRPRGAPKTTSLRRMRVALRGQVYYAPLTWFGTPSSDDQACLALCVLTLRHGGLRRTRGLGHLQCALSTKSAEQAPAMVESLAYTQELISSLMAGGAA